MCTRKPPYDSSVTDTQWVVIEPLLPRTNPRLGGRPPLYSRTSIIDTISYVLVSRCARPHDLAPWNIAHQWLADGTRDRTWGRVHEVSRGQVREVDGRDPQPSAAVLGSRSVKSSEDGAAIGDDAGKRVRGPARRHLGHPGLMTRFAMIRLMAARRLAEDLEDRPSGFPRRDLRR